MAEPTRHKSALSELEDWLTSAPGREASLKFTSSGFECHIWERSRDGKLYGAQRTAPRAEEAIESAVLHFRAEAMFLTPEFNYGE